MQADVKFCREMNRNYMILRPVQNADAGYSVKMLTENKIGGLLKFQIKNMNGECRYYYDVTSRQPLRRILEFTKLSESQFSNLIIGILYCAREMQRYFLDENELMLDPDFIYMEPDTFEPGLCLFPGSQKEFGEAFQNLAQYLLDHVDTNDSEAVMMAFSIFQESRKENFGLERLEFCLRLSENRDLTGESGENQKLRTAISFRKKMVEEDGIECCSSPNVISENNRAEKDCKELTTDISKGLEFKKIYIAGIVAVPAVPAIFAFLFGLNGIIYYRWVILGLEGILLAGIVGGIIFDKRGTRQTEMNHEPEKTWEVLFCEEEEQNDVKNIDINHGTRDRWDTSDRKDRRRRSRTSIDNNGKSSRVSQGQTEQVHKDSSKCEGRNGNTDSECFFLQPASIENSMQTILLTSKPNGKEGRILVAEEGEEMTEILYFPFLIGKSKQMADFYIDDPAVSRLHLRIDKTEFGYEATDLNSTNGTSISGHILSANETYPLKTGDTIKIAGRLYRFM